jgi:hypothetical protein
VYRFSSVHPENTEIIPKTGSGPLPPTSFQINFFTNHPIIEFEVLTAVVMKNSIFWDTTPCSPLKVNRHFGGTCGLHVLGRRINHARKMNKAGSKQKLIFNGLRGVTSQKPSIVLLFAVTNNQSY